MNPLLKMNREQRTAYVNAQNLLGFEGDMLIKAEVQRLVEKHNIDTIVETGTFKGNTTLKFAEMVNNVITIESNNEYYQKVQGKFPKNVNSILGDSAKYIFDVKMQGNLFFYLDAHWYKNCPLLGELDGIAKNKYKPVIAIHDWKVPNKDFGFDRFPNGKNFELKEIKPSLDRIYGTNGYTYHYNEKAEGCYRGIIFIEPLVLKK
jgi:hypothetical protein